MQVNISQFINEPEQSSGVLNPIGNKFENFIKSIYFPYLQRIFHLTQKQYFDPEIYV